MKGKGYVFGNLPYGIGRNEYAEERRTVFSQFDEKDPLPHSIFASNAGVRSLITTAIAVRLFRLRFLK